MISGIHFVLASSSPRRAQLLSAVGIAHEVVPADVSEEVETNVPPQEVVERLALRKARSVAVQFPDSLVLGADTIVTIEDKILGKPRDEAEAQRMLKVLSGRRHTVYTGVALVQGATGRETLAHEATTVRFAPLTDEEIRAYVSGGSPMDKAGAYGIQEDLGAAFIEGIEGDYFCVVGLPLHRLYLMLKTAFPEFVSLEGRMAAATGNE